MTIPKNLQKASRPKERILKVLGYSQSGIGISEVLVSLFLTSIIMTILIQFYLIHKRQYLQIEKILEAHLDIQWVSDLLSDSVRRSGFTPCLAIERLNVVDNRRGAHLITGLSIDSSQQLITINRMNEQFSKLLAVQSPTQIVVSPDVSFNEHRELLIADCYHAEIHQIIGVNKGGRGYVVTLAKPLVFSYPSVTYVGEWIEEKWFIKKNPRGVNTLHYQLNQTEELSALIHSLTAKMKPAKEKLLVEILLGLDDAKIHRLVVAVRGS